MSSNTPAVLPLISDAHVRRACELLDLPTTAFSGTDGQDARLPLLKSLATVDIEACPGSGKTTLLVAKLIILGGIWSSRRSGMCVLSHTNVGRDQIAHRLAGTRDAQRLLSHPHFIGTIHRFVNEYLAIPWLRSLGYPVELIDDDLVLESRWRRLPQPVRLGLEQANHTASVLRFRDVSFGVGDVTWGRGALGKETPTYQALRTVCRESALAGRFCHDEMFLWANELLDQIPTAARLLRHRFPVLLLDEVQDNSEDQSSLLNRVFMADADPVLRQRYGDANQAIYGYAAQKEGAETDPFPLAAIRKDISTSFRFTQAVADLAAPLALEVPSLRGMRQPTEEDSDTSDKHAIFLFDDETIGEVLGAYASYLTEVFSERELQHGHFTAVGAVHRPGSDSNVPRRVGHYWPDYDHERGRAEPQPKTFVDYLRVGRQAAQESGEAHALVERIAEAVLRLSRLADSAVGAKRRRRKHRHVLELLGQNKAARAAYLDLVRALAVERKPLTADAWTSTWQPAVTLVAESLAGTDIGGSAADAFREWDERTGGLEDTDLESQPENVFRYPADGPRVSVRVGSIHSVKGETHTATLVLETYYYAHHLKMLKPWLLGERLGATGASAALRSRLKLHYVAMTRAARLLCLAMKADSFDTDERSRLRAHGWRVALVSHGGTAWLD